MGSSVWPSTEGAGEEGSTVGKEVASTDGSSVGASVGARVGRNLRGLFFLVGAKEGVSEGLKLVSKVGDTVCSSDGPEGTSVGSVVG